MEKQVERPASMVSAKRYTLALAIISTFLSISQIMGIFGVINSKKMVAEGSIPGVSQAQFETLKGTIANTNVPLLVGQLVLVIILTGFFYYYNRQLKHGKIVGKIPYIIYLLLNVIGIVQMLLTGINLSSAVSLVVTLLFSFPAIMAIIHLFKLEPDDEVKQWVRKVEVLKIGQKNRKFVI